MESEGNSRSAEVERVRTASFTGDLDKDWGRFEGVFDRIDLGLRHRLACLLGFNGLWLLGVTHVSPQNGVVWLFAPVWLYVCGFGVSFSLYWTQYRAVAHRRLLVRDWEARYSDQYPSPGGMEISRRGNHTLEPHALVPLTLALFWLVATGYQIESTWDVFPAAGIARLSCALAGAVVVIALLVFAEAFLHFRAAVDPERKPPRKW